MRVPPGLEPVDGFNGFPVDLINDVVVLLLLVGALVWLAFRRRVG
jgi:hypothetical protein